MVQVRTSVGVLEGDILENKYGRPYYSFKGVPYAEPPIADLRFKAPKPIRPWDGIRQAKQFGPCCPQNSLFNKTCAFGSEDCLYLNVYSPNISPQKALPVMFWIHGGGFVCGSSDEYEPDFLIRHGVILVTINYRLGVLGFLSLNSKEAPGNAGMKDQVEAMKWVQQNIAYFGGDPNNVTIFGESAGAACVSFHLISPMTKGLFKRAIVQSGSFFTCWARNTFPRERAIALARRLGSSAEDDKEIYDFLKSQPVESLIKAHIPITYKEKKKNEVHFSIVNEKDFGSNERYFYGDVFESVAAGIHEDVEIINGCTEHEGTILTVLYKNIEAIFQDANTIPEFFVPRSILMKCTLPQAVEIGNKIRKFYFKHEEITMNTLLPLINFCSMEMFVFGSILLQNMCAQRKENKIYSYKFTFKSERRGLLTVEPVLEPTAYTSHSDDLGYIFPMRNYNQEINVNSKSFRMVDEITKLWTNFAKYGDPTPESSSVTKWLPYTLENKTCLVIGEQLVLKELPFDAEEIKFWTEIYKEFYPIKHY